MFGSPRRTIRGGCKCRVTASATPATPAATETPETAQAQPAQAGQEKTGILGGMRKRLTSIFGS